MMVGMTVVIEVLMVLTEVVGQAGAADSVVRVETGGMTEPDGGKEAVAVLAGQLVPTSAAQDVTV